MVNVTIFQAIIYGIVQGLGEFLPISSTAHLILVPWLLKWPEPKLSFDVALHLGTLAAVIGFFWKDWISLIKAGWNDFLRIIGVNRKSVRTKEGNLFWFIVVATIPGAIFGKLFEQQVENALRSPVIIGFALIIMGIVLYAADKYGKKKHPLEKMSLGRSILIGLSQALALIPGVSRSGITIATGLSTGLTRESAAKFSFFMSAPIILGSVILKVGEFIHPDVGFAPLITAIITSAIVGLLSIKFLLDYLKNKGFGIFVWYRLIIGALVIAIFFIRG